jgi:hypothetical protein
MEGPSYIPQSLCIGNLTVYDLSTGAKEKNPASFLKVNVA